MRLRLKLLVSSGENFGIGSRAAQVDAFFPWKRAGCIGFDDLLIASYIEPALTTIRQPKEQMGRLATEIAPLRRERRMVWDGPALRTNRAA